jgi:hypothetical protein
MTLVRTYALGRLAFGGAALAAPALTGRLLAGEGGATADAGAFLRGMGGRELGIGLGLLRAERAGDAVAPWLVAGVLADAGDAFGIAGGWAGLAPDKRVPGIAMAGAAAVAGIVLLALGADA